jgi:hypothetical protein
VPAALHQRLLREWERHQFVGGQIRALENERARKIRTASGQPIDQVRKLLGVRGIGANSAWLYVMEFFAWRQIRNRGIAAVLVTVDPDGDFGLDGLGEELLGALAEEVAQHIPGLG